MAEERFIDNGDGTITDTLTTLMWMKEDSFQMLKKFSSYYHCEKVLAKLNGEAFAGYSDWRFPDKHEAFSLFEEAKVVKDKYDMDIHIDPIFPPGGGFSTWTSHKRGKFTAYNLSYSSGTGGHKETDENINDCVRFVRGELDAKRYKKRPIPQPKDVVTRGGGWR
ncbi:MAG: DUF1566 domain-containing protein [Candidatus Nitrohelix vancouverensis]|uniref:DUF1566 domain-containing protein n=1 Tax=Candidatus Nitrohelix vancouverensis TaxID=2705534 RepID=A0A7T0C2A0_9BACT|nr:MAG: DUF1566 domain-containing protein [Candidatus Nitrohelix vancouverensis]